jgi:hypothetical protein
MKKNVVAHKMIRESGQLTTFGGTRLMGIYREVAACKSVPISAWAQLEKRWARVTCKKCLKLKPKENDAS